MSIDKIKSNMSWLQDRMPQDAEFWKIAWLYLIHIHMVYLI
jgi:hypothetical protein